MSVSQQARGAQARERQQIVAGLLAALERRGPAAFTEADVIEAAGISVPAFREHFHDLDECFDFTCEAGLDVLLSPMAAAWSVPRPPRERLDAAVAALLDAIAAEPRLAELCLLHSPVRQRDRRTYRRAVASLAELLIDVRRSCASSHPAPEAMGAEECAARVAGLIANRLAAKRALSLEELRPYMEGILL